MPETNQEFRTPRWLRYGLGAATVAAGAGVTVWIYFLGPGGAWLGIAGVAVLAASALDSVTTRVTLDPGALVIVSTFRRRTIARREIDSVTWESGVGVSVKLIDGAWVRLPDVGNSQSRANSIRAWLRRGER